MYHPDIKALDHVSFDIQPGETVALLGPNGAGKSTAIDTMLGLRAPTSGEVRILGGPAAAAVAAGQIGGMLQTGGLPEGAKVSELIGLFRQLYRDRRSTAELLALAGIADLADRRVERLSGGQTQRVRFALALAGNPELLFLDEPTAALDVEARRHFWRSVRDDRRAGHHRAVRHALPRRGGRQRDPDHRGEPRPGRRRRHPVPDQGLHGQQDAALHHASARTRRTCSGCPGSPTSLVNGDAVTVRTGDADATLPALYALGRPVKAMEVGGGGLEESLIALTSDGEVHE